MPRDVLASDSLDSIWEEIVYNKASLKGNTVTEPMVSKIDPFIFRLISLREGQLKCWEEEQVAQALVDYYNFMLDRLVEEFGTAKLASIRKENPHWKEKEARESGEYTLYIKKGSTISDIVRLGLASELPVVEPWADLIRRETDASLLPFAERFADLVSKGKEAVVARAKALVATSEHRTRQINPFIKELNDARTSMHGQLLDLSTTLKVPKSWADTFFRKSAGSSPNKDEARGIAKTIVAVLALRKITLIEEQKKKLTGNLDFELFDQWISRLLSAQDANELLAGS
jgi:flagellin-specific chaperone FliS